MDRYSDDAIRKFRWRLYLLVEAEPRVVWSALVVAVITATLAWKLTAPAWRVVLGAPAWPIAAALSALAIAAAIAVNTLRAVARLDSPDTPFPTYHLRRLLEEARAPKPQPEQTLTVTLIDNHTDPHVPAVVLDDDPNLTRTPHACCPHDLPTEADDPVLAVRRRIRRRNR